MTAPQNWRSPPKIFATLNAEYRYDLDGAADSTNHLLPDYSSKERPVSWADRRVFCNPPFSMIEFFARLIPLVVPEHCTLLVPARTDRPWFRRLAPHCELFFFDNRVRYVAPPGVKESSPAFNSMLLIWDQDCYMPNKDSRTGVFSFRSHVDGRRLP